jgi:hypothetical protein
VPSLQNFNFFKYKIDGYIHDLLSAQIITGSAVLCAVHVSIKRSTERHVTRQDSWTCDVH